jgi:hypothetical protein
MRLFLCLAAPLLATALAACGSGGGTTGGSGGTGGQTTQTSVCSSDPRAEAYAVGLAQKSMDGTVTVTFVSAEPAPPAKGGNTFTVDITDAMGKPIDGATVAVKPFMPDHGHGASVTPTVSPRSQAGRYDVTNVELFMPGIWEITFTITATGGAPEPVKFTFCVDG